VYGHNNLKSLKVFLLRRLCEIYLNCYILILIPAEKSFVKIRVGQLCCDTERERYRRVSMLQMKYCPLLQYGVMWNYRKLENKGQEAAVIYSRVRR
jgi:hypothetical protein